MKVNVWAFLSQGLWEDASAIIKPCSCEGVFVGGTVHLFRVTLEILHCSGFSNSRFGNSYKYWWVACHLVSSKASLRHLQLVPVPDMMLCLFWWAPSYRSRAITSPLPLRRIPHAILSLVPLLHFRGAWIYSCVRHAVNSPFTMLLTW